MRFSQNEFFLILKGKNLHFSSTYIHQTFESCTQLYYEDIYRGICKYVIPSLNFITLCPHKHGENLFFKAIDSIF